MPTINTYQIQQAWTTLACQLFGNGNPAYAIRAMYLEFANVSNPATVIAAPSFPITQGLEYFAGLALTAEQDYLRVPLLQTPQLGEGLGYDLPINQFNQLMFFTQTAGLVGVNGKPFSAANNSKIYGAALVATPVPNDPTQDLVAARAYFGGDDQIVKTPSSQVSVTWPLLFT